MQTKLSENIINIFYALIWLMISLWCGVNHEIFADEAQAYLIARDASISEILTTVARTEGTPALWFLWLKLLIFWGLDYSHLYIASILPNFIGVCLFITKAPFSKVVKYVLPLTYFVLYQYNIVARNYSLLFLTTVIASIAYGQRQKHPYRLVWSLIFLGSTTSHAFLLSCSIMLFWMHNDAQQAEGIKGYQKFIKGNLRALSLFGIFIIFSVLYLYPESSNQYISNYELIKGFRARNILALFSVGLITSSVLSPENLEYIFIGLCYSMCMIGIMTKEYKLKFGILLLPNILFMLYVPYKPWHAGIIIMSIMFLLWQEKEEVSHWIKIGIGLLFVMQIIWSYEGITTDIKGKYSVGKDIHTFLEKQNISSTETKIAAFNGISLHIYENNPNFSYWDWREHGFTQRVTSEDIKQKRAIIINKEVYDVFNKRIKEIQEQGKYQIKVFKSDHFFALQDMGKDETLYVLYRDEP